MSVQITNIVQGVLGKLKAKRKLSRFPVISWLKEKRLKHEDDQTIKTIELGNMQLRYKRPYEVLHTYKELFEDEIYNFKVIGNAPFIIDCGSNIGLSVLYFKKLYPAASVLAFEPDSENFKLLSENVRRNGLTNVECRQHAIWIHNDAISFVSNGTQASQISTGGQQQNISVVKAERLADIIKDTEVDFLKIDIEGAELEVLKDCEPYLKNVKNLFVEYHGKVNETEKLQQLLAVVKSKYKVYIKMAADHLHHPFVENTTKGSFDVQLNIFCYQ